jgi:hypothetical protein
MRRYERASNLLTSKRSFEDWGKLLGEFSRGQRCARPVAASRALASNVAHEVGELNLRRRAIGRGDIYLSASGLWLCRTDGMHVCALSLDLM